MSSNVIYTNLFQYSNIAPGRSTAVEQSPNLLKVEGSNLAAFAGTIRNKMAQTHKLYPSLGFFLSFSFSLFLFLYLFFSHSLILSFSHSLILSFSRSLILSFSHSLIHSFTHSLILSFSHSDLALISA